MIIDFHTHVFPPFFREERTDLIDQEPAFDLLYHSSQAKLIGVTELIASMDEQEVHKSVIFGFPWKEAEHFRRHNDYVLDAVHAYPDRLIGFGCFSPLSSRGADEAERCLKAGLSGVGELAVYDSGLSAEIVKGLEEVLAVCTDYDVPCLLHTNEPVGHEYHGKTPTTLREIYGFVKAYPANKVVLAHWGGGLFFYALMKREVKECLRNVWFDTAASPFLYEPLVYSLAGALVGFEKILLGSDYPLLKPERYLKEMDEAGLSTASKTQIMGSNAANLLNISA
jgi:predicted TIM-barrel fold metal-dependent hydrolase